MTKILNEQIVTVIIPSRVYDFLLKKCITEIRNLYKNVAINIILDENHKVCDLNLNNVKIIQSKQTNISAKRNLGVHNCETEYVAFIDSDAYPKENWLENGIKFLEENKNYSVVTGNYLAPQNETFMQTCIRLVQFSPLFIDTNLMKLIEKYAKDSDEQIFSSANFIMRREDYIKIGGMNKNIYLDEDSEFSYRLYINGYKIRFKNDVSIYHRVCNLFPYIRKVFCYGYYKTNMYIQEKKHPEIGNYFTKKVLKYIIPLSTVLIYFILILITKNLWIIIIPPLFAFILLIFQAIYSANKLNSKKIPGFFIIFYISILFCLTFIISSLLGILNIPIKNVQHLYKNY